MTVEQIAHGRLIGMGPPNGDHDSSNCGVAKVSGEADELAVDVVHCVDSVVDAGRVN